MDLPLKVGAAGLWTHKPRNDQQQAAELFADGAKDDAANRSNNFTGARLTPLNAQVLLLLERGHLSCGRKDHAWADWLGNPLGNPLSSWTPAGAFQPHDNRM